MPVHLSVASFPALLNASSIVKVELASRECVIIGANDRIEIWEIGAWNEFLKENEENLSNIAENLFVDVNL